LIIPYLVKAGGGRILDLVKIRLSIVNAYLIRGDGGNVLVDTGVQETASSLVGQLGELGIGPGDLTLIVLTHAHTDHFGGMGAVKKVYPAPVAVQREDAPWLEKGINGPMKGQTAIGRFAAGRPRPVESDLGVMPEIIWDDELDLRPYGVAGRLLHTPGHTAGSAAVVLDSGDILIGDMLMGRIPRHVPKTPFIADDMNVLVKSLTRLLALKPTAIWPGHGGPFTPERVAAWISRYEKRMSKKS